MSQFQPTARTTLHRRPTRASYDRATVEAILDEGLYCHIGFNVDNQPYVIPTIHARAGDQLYIHGSSASRMLRNLKQGVPMCVTVTTLDGLVLARSAFQELKDRMDPRQANGGVFLGLNGIVIKSHGGTDAEGFAAAIEVGYGVVRDGLLAKITTALGRMHEAQQAVGGAAS